MKQATEPAPIGSSMMTIASAVMRVAELNRSVDFYCGVFCCRVVLREPETALLLTPGGFQIYLHSAGPTRRPRLTPIGVQFLMWATDSQAELERVAARLRAHDPATYTYTENALTFVEGCDPDHGRVILAYPSPSRLPRELIASRLRGVVRAASGAGVAREVNASPAQSN